MRSPTRTFRTRLEFADTGVVGPSAAQASQVFAMGASLTQCGKMANFLTIGPRPAVLGYELPPKQLPLVRGVFRDAWQAAAAPSGLLR